MLKKKHGYRVKLIKQDLTNYLSLKKKIKKINPNLIFHIASDADVRGSFDHPIEISNNNNTITINLLEACRKTKIDPLIVICSTSEVYGRVKKKDMPVTENNKISPINPYAVTKAYQDLMSQVYNKSFGLKIIITRMFSYSNARRKNLFQTAFAKQIVDCERGSKKIVEHGNLKSIRTFVDIEDAMESYWLSAKKGKIGEIYNICGNKIISVKDYLQELRKNSKVNFKTKLNKSLLRPQDIDLQIGECSKFKKHTGWKPKVSFRKSVKKLLEEVRLLY